MVPYIWTQSLFRFGEIRSIVCYCTHEEKINFAGFTQNGCYGNQPQPNSVDVNNSCSFTKQDLIFKQAYLVGLCFVLFNKLKFWQLALVYSAFYRLYLEITLFCTKPSEQIIYCHVTDVKMSRFLSNLLNNHTIGLVSPHFRNFSLILSKVEMLAWNQLVQKWNFEKNALKVFLKWWIKHLTSQTLGEGV